MPRRKRNSLTLERANRRLESLLSISRTLDFGDGVSVEAYDGAIDYLASTLASYNTALSTLDSLADEVNRAEQIVLALSEKLLLCVGGRYGKTSKEYEMAGGSRRTSRRRSSTSTVATDATSDSSSASTNQTTTP